MARFQVPTQHMYGVMYRDSSVRAYEHMLWSTYLFDTELERDAMIKDLESGSSVWATEAISTLRIEVDVPITIVENHRGEQEILRGSYVGDD